MAARGPRGSSSGDAKGDLVTRLASGAAVVLVGRIGGRGIHVLGHIVMARWLGAAGFGLFAVGWTLLNTVGLLAPLGLDKGVIRFGGEVWRSRDERDRRRLKGILLEGLTLSAISGGVLAVLVFALAPVLANDVFSKPELVPVLRLFAPAFVLLPLMRVSSAATRITQNMAYSALAESLLQPVAALGLFVLFALLGMGLLGAVGATVLSFAGAVVLAVVFVLLLFPVVRSVQVKATYNVREMLRFSLPASLAGMLTLLTTRADRLFVAYFQPAADVGVYQAVSQIAILFGIILSGFAAILMPMAPELYAKDKTEDLEAIFRLSTRWALYVSLPFLVVMILAPQPLIATVYGAEFTVGAAPLVILAFSQLTNAGTGPVGPLLVMTGHQDVWAKTAGSVLTANAILNITLIPRFGLVGAASASVLSMVLLFGIGLHQIRRHIGIWPYDRSYLKGLVAVLTTAGAVHIGLGWWSVDSLLELGVLILAAGTLFWAQIVILGLSEEDRILMSRIKRRMAQR